MDGLTLNLLAVHQPKQAVLDWGGDLWHAHCYRQWVYESNSRETAAALLPNSFVCTDERRHDHLCFLCEAPVEYSTGSGT